MADAHPIFGASPIPRYLQLADIFRQRVARGKWPAGAALPPLDALMREFSVARVTVRQAVRLLAGEGLLSPQRGRGTFVTAHPGNERHLKVETTLADLVEMYRDDTPELENIAEGPAWPRLREGEGGLAPGYFHMRRVHARNRERYCVISIYIDERIFRRAPKRFRRETILPVLTSLPGIEIAGARQVLTIAAADVDAARHIGIPLNAPIAEVRRVLTAPDRTVIYLAEVTYRGDYIHLDMDLRP